MNVPGHPARRSQARSRWHLYAMVKALAERMAAVLLLVALTPLILVVAVLVRLASPGPAFYRQTRLGKGGRQFTIHKIRTMTHDCEAVTGAVWAARHDPRITPLGRLLRDSHIDELPQLWNVVRGQMSLIGPRPERPEIAAQLEKSLPEFSRRLSILPGLTGLAQVRLGADHDLDDSRAKLAHDLYYIQKLGFILDFRIALATFFHCTSSLLEATSHWIVRSCGPELRAGAPRSRLAVSRRQPRLFLDRLALQIPPVVGPRIRRIAATRSVEPACAQAA